MKVLLATSTEDFDPTEVAIPWKVLSEAGVEVHFATDTGTPGKPDPIMLSGENLGMLKGTLIARKDAQDACKELQNDPLFQNPISYEDVDITAYDGLILPGGHAKQVRPYLESKSLQSAIVGFFNSQKPVAAICHGVVAAARAVDPATGKSVLYGRTTTALLNRQERLAYRLTKHRVGDYYLTYPVTVEDEVTAALQNPSDFKQGPLPLFRDSADNMGRGFTHRDGNYISARWPGDVYNFSHGFLEMLFEQTGKM